MNDKELREARSRGGKKGGKAPVGAFKSVKGLASSAGRKGALIGKRGRKYLYEENGFRYYENKSNGNIEKYEIK